jgi:hypothetical protein
MVSMSSWMFDEEESQESIRRSDTCQRQERNGEAAHGKVRARRGNKSSRCASLSRHTLFTSHTITKMITIVPSIP